jgi:hypothetical protein
MTSRFTVEHLWTEFIKYVDRPATGISRVGDADVIFSLVVGRLTTGLMSITLIISYYPTDSSHKVHT